MNWTVAICFRSYMAAKVSNWLKLRCPISFKFARCIGWIQIQPLHLLGDQSHSNLVYRYIGDCCLISCSLSVVWSHTFLKKIYWGNSVCCKFNMADIVSDWSCSNLDVQLHSYVVWSSVMGYGYSDCGHFAKTLFSVKLKTCWRKAI